MMQETDHITTERLIFWDVEKNHRNPEHYVFKHDYDSKDNVVILFYGRDNNLRPNKGSVMMVSYFIDEKKNMIGTCLEATDQGAYD